MLTDIIQKGMRIPRAKVYIANIVKCRPPANRNPEPDEICACLPYLERQIDIIRPRVICSLGNVATQTLTGIRRGITTLRGTFHRYRDTLLVPTFHPAACLRNPSTKKDVWEDVQKIMKELNLKRPGVMKDGAGKNGD
jgi:DNA polymerase